MHAIDSSTQLCAVVGSPVNQSLGPAIHNAAFEAAGLNFVYLAFDVEDLESFLRGMRATEGFRGLSVTIPHKERILEYLDDVDPLAAKVGSVNTVIHDERGLRGTTTDGEGAMRALKGAGVDLSGKRILFLGSGGAVRSVAFAIGESGLPSCITVLGRTPSKVEALARDLEKTAVDRIESGELLRDLGESIAAHDVVINGTSVGMRGSAEGESLVPGKALSKSHVVFDMVYNPPETVLLRAAAAAGSTIVRGGEMFVHQGGLQFELWTGHAAPMAIMRESFLAGLGQA